MSEGLEKLDTTLFFIINRGMENSVFDILMPFITAKAYLIVLPFLLFYIIKEKKKALPILAISFISILIADGLSNTLKHLIARERPCNVLYGVHLLAGCSSSFSMPSNHASNAFAFAVPIFLSKNRLRYLFLFIALVVSFSRVYVGVHYPLDVLVGAVVGIISSITVITVYKGSLKSFSERPYFTIMIIFLSFLSLFRVYYILHGPLDLSPDEAHYWEWSRRLDLSYYSKGPMIAYLIAAGTWLFGDNVFGVRSLAVLFSILSSIYLYKFGKEMYDERTGALSAIIFQLIPLYSAFGVIFTIDSPFVFFWIISTYILWKAVSLHHNALWYLLGLFIGLGLLTKYTMAFFYLSAFLFIIVKQRELIKREGPYMAVLISLLVFSPVIIWNAQHDGVTVRHTAAQAHLEEGLRLSLKSLLEFLGSQIGIITPLLFILIIFASVRISRDSKRGSFLFWFFIPVLAFFTLKSLHGKVQANWAMTGYITGIIALCKDLELRASGNIKTWVAIVGILLALVLTLLSHYPPALIPVKLDPSSRLKGWKDLGQEVTKIYEEMEGKGSKPFIFSDRYQVSSELAFYVKGHPVTYCVNLGRRMNQYDLWPDFKNLVHHNAIFVTIGMVELPQKIRDAFERCDSTFYGAYKKDKLIREYTIFTCYDFRGIREEEIRSY